MAHNKCKTRIYYIWTNMKSRCNNPNVPKYKIYGGRGISVSDSWLRFEGFYNDMKDSYDEHLTLDRIDNNGNYCKENCRWATPEEQGRNKRNNILLKGKTLSEWSEILDIKRSTLAQRYYVYNWSVERTLELN